MYSSKTVTRSSVDVGFQKFFMGIYNYMALGLALTGAVAFAINVAPPKISMFFHSISLFAWIATLALVFFISARVDRMPVHRAQTLFWVYAAVVGISISAMVSQYSLLAISRAFFTTALTFGGASAYGYMTKRDLTKMGSFLIMGVIGLFITSLVNLVVGSSISGFVISILGVVIFTGLTAYDTQTIRDMYFRLPHDQGVRERASIMGALSLYLDVLNIFLYMLRLGNRD